MPQWTVSKEQSGKKLVQFLSDCLPTFSQRKIKAALERNCCEVNGCKERFASATVVAGDRIVFDADAAQRLLSKKSAQKNSVSLLFEDEFFLIYNKPPGITSEQLLALLQKTEQNLFLGHRIDRDTSGILIFVKNEDTRQRLIKEFQQLQVKKSYLAIVDGIPSANKGHIENELAKRGERGGRPFWGSVPKGKGSRARTEWKVERRAAASATALLRCTPLTGRTHQIRVHLSESGHPILGDDLYGERFMCRYTPPRCLLHALEMTLRHPHTKEMLCLQAPIPDDMLRAMQDLGLQT